MNHYIKLLAKSIALKNDLSESQVLELGVLLLALGLEPEAAEYPMWIRVVQGAADDFESNVIAVMQEALNAYIDEMEGEDGRDDDL